MKTRKRPLPVQKTVKKIDSSSKENFVTQNVATQSLAAEDKGSSACFDTQLDYLAFNPRFLKSRMVLERDADKLDVVNLVSFRRVSNVSFSYTIRSSADIQIKRLGTLDSASLALIRSALSVTLSLATESEKSLSLCENAITSGKTSTSSFPSVLLHTGVSELNSGDWMFLVETVEKYSETWAVIPILLYELLQALRKRSSAELEHSDVNSQCFKKRQKLNSNGEPSTISTLLSILSLEDLHSLSLLVARTAASLCERLLPLSKCQETPKTTPDALQDSTVRYVSDLWVASAFFLSCFDDEKDGFRMLTTDQVRF